MDNINQPHITPADAERQLKQERHRLQRAENRKAYLRSKEERDRAHRLITRGATIEYFFPEIKELTEREFYGLAEQLHDMPAVRILFHEAAAQHVSEPSEKEAG